MKKKLTVIISVLLVLCVLAAAVKIGRSDHLTDDPVIIPVTGSGSDSGTSDETFFRIDPELGVDIFDYQSIFSIENGKEFESYNFDDGEQDPVTMTYVDEEFVVTGNGVNGFSLMSYEFSCVYRVYFYISNDLSSGKALTFRRLPVKYSEDDLFITVENLDGEQGDHFIPPANGVGDVKLCGTFTEGRYLLRTVSLWIYEE